MTNDPVPGAVGPTPPTLPAIPPLPPLLAPSGDGWAMVRRWARILLARNPFYIISAALLLWSMRRLSLDSRIFHDELPQLLFNFSSFEAYELLLAFTAIVLARRHIWYDSGLLVGLENLFICVPFLLVSQALLLENGIAFALCLTGCGFALLRVGALKRRLPDVNMPAALLWSGAFLLCYNLAWPVLIRFLHRDVSLPSWDERGLTVVSVQWNWIIPAAVALGALPPIRPLENTLPPGEEAPFFSWRSFPLLTLLMWTAGTCVHLYCISYVYGLPWSISWLTPAVWMASWVLWRQVNNFVPAANRIAAQRILLFPPILIVLLAALTERWAMCLTLAVVNAFAYGAIALVRRERFAWHFCIASALVSCAFVPHSAVVRGNLSLGAAIMGGVLLYMVAWAIFSPRPRLGIAGGICLSLGLVGFLNTEGTLDAHVAMQAGLIFILLHSLRWNDNGSADVANARKSCALCWLVHSVLWMVCYPADAIYGTVASGAVVLGVYACARLVLGKWGPLVVPCSGMAVLVWGPSYLIGEHLLRAPAGVLTLLGSFALFGLGTGAALMKGRLAKTAAPAKIQ